MSPGESLSYPVPMCRYEWELSRTSCLAYTKLGNCLPKTVNISILTQQPHSAKLHSFVRSFVRSEVGQVGILQMHKVKPHSIRYITIILFLTPQLKNIVIDSVQR